MRVVGQKLRSESGLTPGDIQTAFRYDHCTPFVLVQPNEAFARLESGEAQYRIVLDADF